MKSGRTVLTVALAALLVCGKAQAVNYERGWKQVESMIEKDLPESALNKVLDIKADANKHGDGLQLLRCWTAQTQIESGYKENYVEGALLRIDSLLPLLKEPYAAVACALKANCYREWYENNSWNIAGNEAKTVPDADFTKWNELTFRDTILYWLDRSISRIACTPKTDADDADADAVYGGTAEPVEVRRFLKLFDGGNSEGQELRPYIEDVLLENALLDGALEEHDGQSEIYKDSILYGSADDFLACTAQDSIPWNLMVLRKMTLLHRQQSGAHYNNKSMVAEQASVDLLRIETLQKSAESDRKLLAKGALELGLEYLPKTELSASFIWIYSLGNEAIAASKNHRERTAESTRALAELKSYLEMAAAAWPKSKGGVECANLIMDLERPYFSLNAWAGNVPNCPGIAQLDYRNVSHLYFTVYKGGSESLRVADANSLAECEPIQGFELDLTDAGDNMTRSTAVPLPVMAGGPGRRVIVASASDKMITENDALAFLQMKVGRLSLARCYPIDGSSAGFIVDRLDGKAVDSCPYEVWETKRNRTTYHNERSKLVMSGKTDASGYYRIRLNDTLESVPYEIVFRAKSDSLTFTQYMTSSYSMKRSGVYNKVYTDRSTYKPGETVQLTLVSYKSDGRHSGRVLAGQSLKMSLLDVNRKELETLDLETDSLGCASGSFAIPENVLTGQFTLELTDAVDGSRLDWKYINVESYRQPTFSISLDLGDGSHALGSVISVPGNAMYLTGIPLGGAQVSYSIERFISSRHWLVPSESKHLTSGNLKTDAEGNFTIDFEDDAPADGGSTHVYNLSVRVTAPGGETHTEECMVVAGSETPAASVYPGKECFAGAPVVIVSLNNAAGMAVSGRVRVKLWKLVLPEPRLDVSSLLDCDSVPENVQKLFPLYSFEPVDKSCWKTGELLMDSVIELSDIQELELGGLENGSYRVVAEPLLSDGTAAGKDYADSCNFAVASVFDSRMPDTSLLLVAAANDSCQVGDTAVILVGSAFDVRVQYVAETRDGIFSHGEIAVSKEVSRLRIPVTEDLKPGFSIRFITEFQMVQANDYCQIGVIDRSHELNVELKTFRDLLEPDSEELWTIRVTDADGKPAKAALSAVMYDKAMDSYGKNYWQLSPWYGYSGNVSNMWNYSRPTGSVQSGPVDYESFVGVEPEFPSFPSLLNYPYYGGMRFGGMARAGASNLMSPKAVTLMESAVVADGIDPRLAGRVAGLSLVNNDESASEMSDIKMRTELAPTAFFMPALKTDADGCVQLRFKAPQLLTEWTLQGIAHTADLKTAAFSRKVITRKLLMVRPSAPRFMRQGDKLELPVTVNNVSESKLTASVRLELLDARTMEPVRIISRGSSKTLASALTQKVTVPAGGSATVTFPLVAGADASAFIYKVSAVGGGHTDGEQGMVPVLSSRSRVTHSVSLHGKGSFRLDALADGLISETATDLSLTLEYTANPIWQAIQALPWLAEETDPSNERLFHRFFAGSLSKAVIRDNPEIGGMLKAWTALPEGEWQTRLEQNQELKQVLLEQTPWLLDSESEKENLKRLADAFCDGSMDAAMEESLTKLLAAMEPGGGWSWLPGYMPDRNVTMMILRGLGQLAELGAVSFDEQFDDGLQLLCLHEAVSKSLAWIDQKMLDDYKNIELGDLKSVSGNGLEFLMLHTYFTDFEMAKPVRKLYDRLLAVAAKEETQGLDLYSRAQLSLLMSRTGNASRAAEVNRSIVERSLYDAGQGRFWRDNVQSYSWYGSPVSTQTLIVQALSYGLAAGSGSSADVAESEFGNAAREAARWLLQQRQANHWESSPVTAQAVLALLSVSPQGILSGDCTTTVKVGDESFVAGGSEAGASASFAENYGGYLKHTWTGGKLEAEQGIALVSSECRASGWGSLTVNYTDEMDKTASLSNGVSLERKVYRVLENESGTVLDEVTQDTDVRVGDRLRIVIDIDADRNMEYVRLSDMRPAAFEPVSTRSGRQYAPGTRLSYWAAPGNAENVFYIYSLSRGSYELSYDVYVQQCGTFSSGLVQAQCMYAPAFSATAPSPRITAE